MSRTHEGARGVAPPGGGGRLMERVHEEKTSSYLWRARRRRFRRSDIRSRTRRGKRKKPDMSCALPRVSCTGAYALFRLTKTQCAAASPHLRPALPRGHCSPADVQEAPPRCIHSWMSRRRPICARPKH
ncbi:hypothetical protein MRX96_034371 [Rhipicephalus microplus]